MTWSEFWFGFWCGYGFVAGNVLRELQKGVRSSAWRVLFKREDVLLLVIVFLVLAAVWPVTVLLAYLAHRLKKL